MYDLSFSEGKIELFRFFVEDRLNGRGPCEIRHRVANLYLIDRNVTIHEFLIFNWISL